MVEALTKSTPNNTHSEPAAVTTVRSVAELHASFKRLADTHSNLVPLALDCDERLSAWRLTGASGGGGERIRLGFFAGLHGDEPAGALALRGVAELLLESPRLLTGYDLFLYPVCNPWGYENHRRFDRLGRDLNREFWRESLADEVRVLETEILRRDFSGIVSLHADDDSHGTYGFVRGDLLALELLEPALASVESIVPRNELEVIDGFAARRGVIRECYEGVLTAPPRLARTPFEVIFETPGKLPEAIQARAAADATLTMLSRYRELMAFAEGL